MALSVLYFGIVRERIGLREESVELPDPPTVAGLLQALGQRYQEVEAAAGAIRVAVNQEYVDQAAPLCDGDEVAIIPPVSGGAPCSRS